MRKVLLKVGLTLGLTVVPVLASAQKALVYCPNLDRAGCDAVVTALSAGSAYPGGVDRGYDGTSGTVDLRGVDLFAYQVFVVPSLADDATNQPYAFLRDSVVVEHLRAALIGRLALWSGTPDQGSLNRAAKDQLIGNLATWAGAGFGTAHGPGLVALLDLSENEGARYDWLRSITPVHVTSDVELIAYDSIRALSPAASAILGPSAGQLAFASMASFGFATAVPTPGLSLDAVGATGTTQGGQVVLATMQAGNASTAKIWTDRLDYAPGDTVTLHGSGWGPGELVTIVRHEDPLVEADSTILVMADGFGNFIERSFVPDAQDILTRFVMTADGGTSGMRAQTSFTDAKPNAVTLTAQSPNPVYAGFPATFPVSVAFNGNANSCTAIMSGATTGVPAWPAPPAGGFFSFAPPSVTSTGAAQATTLTITTPATMAAGTYHFTVTADGTACSQSGSDTGPVTNFVVLAQVATTLTQGTPSPVSLPFGSAGPVSLTSTLTRTSGGAAVVGATVAFTVNGASAGSAVTSAAGLAGASFNPSALVPGTYAVASSSAAQLVATVGYAASAGAPARTLTITKANPTVSVTGGSFVYDGSPKAATGFAYGNGGVGDVQSPAVTFSYVGIGATTYGPTATAPTNAGTYTATASFAGNTNYNAAGSSASLTITKATSSTQVNCPASVGYNGLPQTPCTVAVTGAGGLSLTPPATYTNNINAGTATASYTFTGDTNHDGSADSKSFTIGQATSTTAITCPVSVIYDGSAQTPCTVAVTGAGGLSLTPTPTYANNTNAGTASASYTFTGDANHSGSTDSKNFSIVKATSTTAITCPASVTFDGSAQTPCTVAVTGSGGLSLTPTPTYSNNTNVGTATASYTFAGDANHDGSSDSKNFAIAKAASTTAISCPASVTFDGSAQTPCTVAVTGSGGLSLTPTPTYSNNTNVGTATASYTFAGDANHDGSSDSKNFAISQATSTTAVSCPVSVGYDGSAQMPCSVAVTGAGGLSLTPTPSYANNTNAGTASASYTFAGDVNHTGSSDSKNFDITKASSVTVITVTNATFDGSPHGGTAVVTGAGGLNESVTVNYAGIPPTSYGPVTTAPSDAGTYRLRATFAGDANHLAPRTLRT